MYEGSIVSVSDNTGAKKVRCLKVFKKGFFPVIGDMAVVSVVSILFGKKVKKKEIYKAVLIRSSTWNRRLTGFSIKFDVNCVVLLDQKQSPVGTRVFGVVGKELRDQGFLKIASLSQGIL